MAQFGKWMVNEEGIKWTGIGNNPEYNEGKLIPLDELEIIQKGGGYDWPLHVLKVSFSREDIYAFNTAFIYGMELAGKTFPPRLLSETFESQIRYFKENGEDDSDEITIGGRE